jgi:hypothetical protein
MERAWDGFGCVEDNVFTTEVLEAWGIRVPLSPIEGVVHVVTLDATVRGLRLFTTDQSVRYAIDHAPSPIGVSSETVIVWGAFRRGDTLVPNQWQRCALEEGATIHELNLLSPGGGVVLVEALKELG